MKGNESIVAMLICALLSSCATPALWDATDPSECIAVTDSSITVEQLKREGVEYYVDDENGRIFVNQSGMRQLGNYTARILGTPFTLVADVAVGVVAAIGIVGYSSGVSEQKDKEYEIGERQAKQLDDPNKPLR